MILKIYKQLKINPSTIAEYFALNAIVRFMILTYVLVIMSYVYLFDYYLSKILYTYKLRKG